VHVLARFSRCTVVAHIVSRFLIAFVGANLPNLLADALRFALH
jgi:hypothetical protein